MKLSLFVSGLVIACLLICGGCDDKIDPVGPANDEDLPEAVTYTADIAPLLAANCLMCHSAQQQGGARNGAPPGVDYDDYAAAVTWSERCNVRIQAGTMPPGGSLSTFDRELYQAWIDQGTPE